MIYIEKKYIYIYIYYCIHIYPLETVPYWLFPIGVFCISSVMYRYMMQLKMPLAPATLSEVARRGAWGTADTQRLINRQNKQNRTRIGHQYN